MQKIVNLKKIGQFYLDNDKWNKAIFYYKKCLQILKNNNSIKNVPVNKNNKNSNEM